MEKALTAMWNQKLSRDQREMQRKQEQNNIKDETDDDPMKSLTVTTCVLWYKRMPIQPYKWGSALEDGFSQWHWPVGDQESVALLGVISVGCCFLWFKASSGSPAPPVCTSC